MTRLLIDAGADVNLQSKFQESALHSACRRNSPELVELLLQQAADPNYQNRENSNSLHIAYSRAEPDQRIIAMLIEAGADQSATDWRGRKPADVPDS